MADIRIRDGRVYTPAGAVDADVVVEGERIAGLISRTDATRAAEDIDAAGKVVLPGLVDLHAHTRTPGYEQKEDFYTASQAAANGGITSFVDMPNVEPPTDTVALFEQKRAIAARDCIVDWGHFVAGTKAAEVAAFATAGATGFKIFQVSGAYPHDPRLALNDDDRLYESFEEIAKTGLPCAVHPFNQKLFELFSERAFAAGRPRDHITFADVYTKDVIWRSAVGILLELQRETGVRLHLLHTHAAGSLKLLRRAKAAGQRVTVAVDPKYYHLTLKDLREQGPRVCPGGFVTEDAERMQTIWESFADGTLDIIDADHAPHTLEEIERQRTDAWTAAMGNPQYDYLLSVVLTDVHQGKLDLMTAVHVLSEHPARIIGRYPQKGAILPGSDADLVLVDLEREVTPTDDATYTKSRWTPYRGRRLVGAPVLTIRRGEVIARDGKVVGRRGSGRYLRGVAQEAVPVEGFRSPGLAFRPVATRR
jgi:dihydroorotase